jgi:hypothetical protein
LDEAQSLEILFLIIIDLSLTISVPDRSSF